MTRSSITQALLALAAVLLVFPAGASARRVCSYPAVKQAPHVRHVVASRLQCTSARKVISAVRLSDDWRGAYYGTRFGYVSYATGVHQNRRRFRCDYRVRGSRDRYVRAFCHDVRKPRVTVRADLRRR